MVVIACGAFLADDRPLAVADNVTDTISLTGTDIFPAMQKSDTNQLQNVIYQRDYQRSFLLLCIDHTDFMIK